MCREAARYEVLADVLCAANSYNEKYYLNPDFDRLPEAVKKETRRPMLPKKPPRHFEDKRQRAAPMRRRKMGKEQCGCGAFHLRFSSRFSRQISKAAR